MFDIDRDLRLQQLNRSDAKALFALVESNRDELQLWLPWVHAIRSLHDIKRRIRHIQRCSRQKKQLHMGIRLEDRLVGIVAFTKIDRNIRSAYFAYWLDGVHQGKGIMTRACKAMANYAFSRMGLNRLEIYCGVENLSSRAIPERLGFQLEGVLRDAERIHDHYIDYAVYAMLARDWDIGRT